MDSKMFLRTVVLLSLSLAVSSDLVRVVDSNSHRDLSSEWLRVLGSSSQRALLEPCNHEETPVWSCHDCNTRLLCTPLGSIKLPCWLPGPNCNQGSCSVESSEECTSTENPTLTETTGTEPTQPETSTIQPKPTEPENTTPGPQPTEPEPTTPGPEPAEPEPSTPGTDPSTPAPTDATESEPSVISV